MKTRVLIKEGEYRLAKQGVMDAKIDAEELYCYMNNCDKVFMFLRQEEEVDQEVEKKYFKLIEKRASRIPLQHITGVQEFMGFEFKVNKNVLIPRQDTEILVTEAAQIIMKKQRDFEDSKSKGALFDRFKVAPQFEILDMCCGSGAIGISLGKFCADVSVTGTDISKKALELASENASNLRAGIDLLEGDMFEALTSGIKLNKKQWGGRGLGTKIKAFDMIVSNPPYIKSASIAILQEEVKKHEPIEALDGGSDGLDFYRTIVENAANWLKPGGDLLMEIGYDQGEDLRKMIRDDGRYSPAEIIKDLPGKDRVVKCRKL